MAEPWALVSSWTTPTPLFVLLNVVIGFIALISVFASRKNEHTPPEHHQHYQIHRQESAKNLLRAPSLFSRVTSFNFSSHSYGSSSAFDEAAPPPENSPLLAPAPTFLSRMTSFNSLHLHRSVEPETNPPETTTDKQPTEPHPAPIERAPSLFERLSSFNRVSVDKSVEPEINPPQSEPAIARAPSLLSRMSSFDFSFYRSAETESEPAPVEAREQRVTRSASELKKKRLPPTMKKSSSERIEKEAAPFGNEEVDAKADDFINRFKQQLRLQRLDSLLRYRNSVGEN